MRRKGNNNLIKTDNTRTKEKVSKRRTIIIIFGLIVFVIYVISSGNTDKQGNNISSGIESLEEESERETAPIDNGITIVVDPGHGGRDPGKVGVNGVIEKDVNLSIALRLRDNLEGKGYRVVMTREEDIGLYSDGDSNKKASDMRKRVDIVNNSGATVAISIHQNSFPDPSCKGAQVFYYGTSQESEIFANIMQEQIKMILQPDNKRLAKADTSYYMLKNTNCPIIIVECGFLTNKEEAGLLIDEEYQDEMAEAICLGLDTYMKVK